MQRSYNHIFSRILYWNVQFFSHIALQLAIKRGGALSKRIILYVAQMISKMLLGHGLAASGSNILFKTLGKLTGPLGWSITIGWAVYDLASPAYRVTIPCVIQIACMRMQLSNY